MEVKKGLTSYGLRLLNILLFYSSVQEGMVNLPKRLQFSTLYNILFTYMLLMYCNFAFVAFFVKDYETCFRQEICPIM